MGALGMNGLMVFCHFSVSCIIDARCTRFFISNAMLKFAENQAKAKQRPVAEL